MKRLCACLCCVLLVLTACGKAQPALQTETVSSVTETTVTQMQPQSGFTEEEQTFSSTEPRSESRSESPTEPQSEPVTTSVQRETTTKRQSASTTAAMKPQTTRETHTLFPIPVRTTGAQTTTAKATTTTRPTTTTTTKPTTTTTTTITTTTTQPSGGYTPPARPARKTCTITIDCRELLERPEKLKIPEKVDFVPKNGYIVKDVVMEFQDGESVYDVLRRVCATHTCTDNCRFCQTEGIQMESTYTPQFDNYYVEGIHQLYEKDCGGTSGWTYWVNDVFPNYGCSSYIVKPGDKIVWVYSIELDANETFE